MGKDNRAHTILLQHTAPFGERFRHRFLEPLTIFRTTIVMLGFVLHGLRSLGRKWIVRIERVPQQRVIGQGSFEPDQEEVGEIGIGYCVVIGRVGEPNVGGLVGERVVGGVGGLDLTGGGARPSAHYAGNPVESALVSTG